MCFIGPPSYQLFRQGEGFSVYTCKMKSTRNPLYRWQIGDGGAINEFAFSPHNNNNNNNNNNNCNNNEQQNKTLLLLATVGQVICPPCLPL